MTAALYSKLWDMDSYRHYSPGENLAQKFVEIAKPDSKIIDFGCGSGKGSVAIHMLSGQDVIALDWADNATTEDCIEFYVHDLTKPVPFKSEYGFCTDVMEHIAPEDVDKVLHNVLAASRNVFFGISCVEDNFGKIVGEPLHLTVENHDWWKEKLESHGCKVKWSEDFGHEALFYVSAYATGDDFAKMTGMNTAEEQLRANIRANLELGLQEVCPHEIQDKPIILLAGGPSLAEHEQEIIERGKAGEIIVTTNGTYNWLLSKGIRPAAQIMVDARPFMSRFVNPVIDSCKYLLSSQCDNSVVLSLPKHQVYLWHSGDSDMVKETVDEYAKDSGISREWYPVFGGTTVVLRGLPLLAMLGFRKVEVFGWDSCLIDGQHHSYQQTENDGGKVFEIIVGGKVFSCNPWMIVQANEVVKVVRNILAKVDGFEMVVRGNGLIAHMLEHAATLSERNENGGK